MYLTQNKILIIQEVSHIESVKTDMASISLGRSAKLHTDLNRSLKLDIAFLKKRLSPPLCGRR